MKTNYNLIPIYANVKSFYSKAYVEINADNETILYSYNTEVARIVGQRLYLTDIDAHITNTTNRHLKEFILQSDIIDKDLYKNKSLVLKNAIRYTV